MGRVAILGATGGIGNALARMLVCRGEQVHLVGRNRDKLNLLGEELGQSVTCWSSTDSSSLEALLREESERQGEFTGIVNCIGSVLLKPAHSTTDDEFREVWETNVMTAFAVVRAAAQLMRAKGGAVVLFASAAATVGLANHEAIAAAKAGVAGLARSAAATYAARNIRVNVISPGLVRTELTRRIWENPASYAASTNMHALGRIGEPEQIASLAAWLLAPENDWITGQEIGLDGGLSKLRPRG
ncbi:MAG: SDR family oxidoreductase [Pirellulales bacterium]